LIVYVDEYELQSSQSIGLYRQEIDCVLSVAEVAAISAKACSTPKCVLSLIGGVFDAILEMEEHKLLEYLEARERKISLSEAKPY